MSERHTKSYSARSGLLVVSHRLNLLSAYDVLADPGSPTLQGRAPNLNANDPDWWLLAIDGPETRPPGWWRGWLWSLGWRDLA